MSDVAAMLVALGALAVMVGIGLLMWVLNGALDEEQDDTV